MTESDFRRVRPVIEMAQRLEAKLHAQLIDRGVAPIDAAIASVYASHQLAARVHGSPIAAIEWMRTALDTIERQAMAA
jgi:hypothetical protein